MGELLKEFAPLKPNFTPGEKPRQETVARHVDYNCYMVVNKVIRSKSQTRLIDQKNFYKSLVKDPRTQAEKEFHNKTWERAKMVMKHMIDVREDCQRHLIEFRQLRAKWQKEIQDCKDVIKEKEEAKQRQNNKQKAAMEAFIKKQVAKKTGVVEKVEKKPAIPRVSRPLAVPKRVVAPEPIRMKSPLKVKHDFNGVPL